MEVVEKYRDKIQFKENELDNVIHTIVNFTNINKDYKSVSIIDKKEEMIDLIIPLLQKYLELNISMNKDTKLEIINVVDKFNFRKEILEILKGNIDINDIEKAGMRLGKKSQSAFK